MSSSSFIGLRNLARRPARTITTIVGVALAVCTLFSVLGLHRGYARGLAAEVDRLGAHILIVPKGCPYDAASMALHGAAWPCYLQIGELARVQAVQGVESVAPVLMTAVPRPDGGQAVYLGMTDAMPRVRRNWQVDGRLPTRGNEALLGFEQARDGKIALGDSFPLPGFPGQQGVAVGILGPTGGAEDQFIHLPMARMQRLLKRPSEVTHMLVRLRDPDQLQRVVRDLKSCGAGLEMNIVPVTHLFKSIQQLLSSSRLLLLCVTLVTVLVAAAGVGNALLMAVSERQREIGVMRALGASRLWICALLGSEAVCITSIGAILGLCLARVGSGLLESWLRGQMPFTPAGSIASLDLFAATISVGVAVFIGLLASMPAVVHAGRMPPACAIRAGDATL